VVTWRASSEWVTRIKQRQRRVQAEHETALLGMQCELELIGPGEISFLAHARMLPSSDLQVQELQQRHDAIEAITP